MGVFDAENFIKAIEYPRLMTTAIVVTCVVPLATLGWLLGALSGAFFAVVQYATKANLLRGAS
jgi:hypothetical protein